MPINNLMEDAATAEIARVQLWQWVKYGSKTVSCLSSASHLADHQDSGKAITAAYLQPIFSEEAAKVAKLPGIQSDHVKIASEYMLSQVQGQWPSDFLTTDLLDHLDGSGEEKPKKAGL